MRDMLVLVLSMQYLEETHRCTTCQSTSCVWAYFCHENCFQLKKKVLKPLAQGLGLHLSHCKVKNQSCRRSVTLIILKPNSRKIQDQWKKNQLNQTLMPENGHFGHFQAFSGMLPMANGFFGNSLFWDTLMIIRTIMGLL